MIDRTIDAWEAEHSASTIKNSIAPLVRVLDEAVRDDVISIDPAKHRARCNLGNNATHTTGALRQYALPDLATLRKLAKACGKVHRAYSDHVMLASLLAARGSEVAGLQVGDVDWENHIVWIRGQHYPGKGGLVVKKTRAAETGPCRCSMPSNRSSNVSPSTSCPKLRSCVGHEAACSPPLR